MDCVCEVIKVWWSWYYVKMVELVFQNVVILKEVQIMSNELNESVVFQFVVVDVGYVFCLLYDMVFNGLMGEGEDVVFEEVQKFCIGVWVVDFKYNVVYFWSFQKFQDCV